MTSTADKPKKKADLGTIAFMKVNKLEKELKATQESLNKLYEYVELVAFKPGIPLRESTKCSTPQEVRDNRSTV